MEKYYLMAINNKNAGSMNNLATYYMEQGDYPNMEKYYLMAIENDSPHAMYNFGYYYDKIKKDYPNLEKYYENQNMNNPLSDPNRNLLIW